MATEHIDTGALNDRIEILTLQEVGSTYTWEVARKTWAKPVLTARRNNFSVHGVGAAGVTFTIRRQPMDLGNAVLWEGRHCFITGIIPLGRSHLVVEAALAEVVQCEAAGEMVKFMDELNRPRLTERLPISFPAVVTEKYQRLEDREVHDTTETVLILTVPKLVPLLPVGRPVTIDGAAAGTYEILSVHPLDRWHNEYEIVRRKDA